MTEYERHLRKIRFGADDAVRKMRGFAKVDLGGGSGRLGSRRNVLQRPSKSSLLRPHVDAA